MGHMESMDIGVIGHNEKSVCKAESIQKGLKKRGKGRIKFTGGAKTGAKIGVKQGQRLAGLITIPGGLTKANDAHNLTCVKTFHVLIARLFN